MPYMNETEGGTAPFPETIDQVAWSVQCGQFNVLHFLTKKPIGPLLQALYSSPGPEKVTVTWSAVVPGKDGAVATLHPLGHAYGNLSVDSMVREAFKEEVAQ